MKIENAVNQANKEPANRFDFMGSKAGIALGQTNQTFRRGQFPSPHAQRNGIGKWHKRSKKIQLSLGSRFEKSVFDGGCPPSQFATLRFIPV
ncbi:MAG: DUF520 family protein [Verrucomicrobiia bacterium]